MGDPLVSVVLPVHNGARYVAEAVQSVLRQTWRDFELLIIDDGSTDGSWEILSAVTDERVQRWKNGRNLGLPATLNLGLDRARGRWIARMDADDVCHPERLAQQVDFLEKNPAVGICGTWAELLGPTAGKREHPVEAAKIRALLLFRCPLVHSSVMLRRELLQRQPNLRYREDFLRSQDYELWSRCAEVTALANVPEHLLYYRIHDQQAGALHRPEQWKLTRAVHRTLLEKLELQPTEDDLKLHGEIAEEVIHASIDYFARAAAWLRVLQKQNDRLGRYDKEAFSFVLANLWKALLIKASQAQVWTGGKFLFFPPTTAGMGWKSRFRYLKQILARRVQPNEVSPSACAS